MNATEINRLISGIAGVQRDYFHCLNACAEFEKMLTEEQHIRFQAELWEITGRETTSSEQNHRNYISATATQRCLAFVATMEASDPTLGADSVHEGKEEGAAPSEEEKDEAWNDLGEELYRMSRGDDLGPLGEPL